MKNISLLKSSLLKNFFVGTFETKIVVFSSAAVKEKISRDNFFIDLQRGARIFYIVNKKNAIRSCK